MSGKSFVVIYGLIDSKTSRLRYIGKAKDMSGRARNHKGQAGSSNTHKDRWLSMLFAEGLEPFWKVLAIAPASSWQLHERLLIAEYRAAGFDLCNITAGGEGVDAPRTDEWKKRISAALMGHAGYIPPASPNPEIACECGCGTMFPQRDSGQRVRRFVTGHNGRRHSAIPCACGCGQILAGVNLRPNAPHYKPGHRPHKPNPIVECACGCGAHFTLLDSGNRPRRFVHNHAQQFGAANAY